jgi:uncharacterized damage-inducible protein DinB
MNRIYTCDSFTEIFNSACDTIRGYEDMDSELFNTKINSETWSVAEILRHITLFNHLYLRKVEKAIHDQSHKVTSSGEFKPGWIVRQLLKVLEPPYAIKIKTISPMQPTTEQYDVGSTVSELTESEEKFLHLITEAQKQGFDLDGIKNNHPVFSMLRMSVTEFFAMTDAHQRRHFWQIEQILNKIN